LGLTPTFTYGRPRRVRLPPRASIFAFDPNTTGFLKTVATDAVSDTAQKFQVK